MDAYGSVIGDGRVRGSDDRTGETSGEEIESYRFRYPG
jgi:hypothetical protein